jgi:hypothetical protein
MGIMKRTGVMGTEQPQDINQSAPIKAERLADPVTEPPAPLRQLLHWATGDRDAEAQALADETIARRDLERQDAGTTNDEQHAAVLTAAKDAVASAHGDSIIASTLNETAADSNPDPINESGTNLLTEWEEAASFAAKAKQDSTLARTIVTDVARPVDVEAIIDAPTNPQAT